MEKSKKLRVLLVMMVLILKNMWSCDCCLENERNALLQLMSSFNSSLLSYSSRAVDCCNWRRVQCNPTTGRVIQLDLYGIGDFSSSGDWYLNASLFLPFQQLKFLDLWGNNIAGCLHNEGFERLSTLSNLESLYLSFNSFNNSILSSLAGLSSLKFLSLSGNKLKGTTNIEELDGLSKLEELHLSRNNITKFVGSIELNNLTNLRGLYIGYNQLKGYFYLKELDGLSKLEELDLSGNNITKFVGSTDNRGHSNLSTLYLDEIPIEGEGRSMLLESLGVFPHLKTLSLRLWNFKGIIIGQVLLNNVSQVEELWLDGSSIDENSLLRLGATMPSLKHLSMRWLHLNGSLSSQGLLNFKNLEYLDLSGNSLDNTFFHVIGTITTLKTMRCSDCGLNGTIPVEPVLNKVSQVEELYLDGSSTDENSLLILCATMPSLKHLSMRRLQINGFLPSQGFCQLEHLEELDIGDNDLSGNLPICLANLSFLQVLDLSSNHFTGNISISPLRGLTSLKKLYLSNNLFQIPISLTPFFNHSQLLDLYAWDNAIYAETEDHNVTPRFQLEKLVLFGQGNGGAIPKFLYHQYSLQHVDLSNIKIEGEFPYWLLENNTNLDVLDLANNSLSGSLRLPIHPHMNLSYLDISDNCLNGSIPSKFGVYLPSLRRLDMFGNEFSGSIPSSFGNMGLLESLDLSNNILSGIIPEALTVGCVSLHILKLSNNSLHGQIFSENFNLKALEYLHLDGNRFNGSIPDTLSNCSLLYMLDMSDNNLSGEIPNWIRNMSSLATLVLSQNNISGKIPPKFCPPSLSEIHLSKNKLQGLLADAFHDCHSLIVLDLSHNNLMGRIPEWIGMISSLSYVLLSHNNLEGEIPIGLCNLDELSLIDLSYNNLSGKILPCLRFNSDWHRQQEAESIALAPTIATAPDPQPQQPLEFTTKNVSYIFQARTLRYFSGIDLSSNNFSGEIPPEMGNLRAIQMLNLSHNNLTGSIPMTFSSLSKIESLDLSYNKLNGKIPPQLTQLYSLAVFSVAHNNLSGKTPQRVAQFATFESGSFEGNPFLCGEPLPKSCNSTISSPMAPATSLDQKEENGFIDMDVFYVSFVVSYIIVLLGIGSVLYINPYWRRAWFYFVEQTLTRSYYFLIDNIPLLSKFGLS